MKLFIVLALLAAAFAAPGEEVDPVLVEDLQVPEFVDFGIVYIPESVAAEVGLDKTFDAPSPVHFVEDNEEPPSFVYETPVEEVAEESLIAPGELESVRVVDLPEFEDDIRAIQYEAAPEAPVFVDAPESNPAEPVQLYDDPTWR